MKKILLFILIICLLWTWYDLTRSDDWKNEMTGKTGTLQEILK